jgi:hypothetical protein
MVLVYTVLLELDGECTYMYLLTYLITKNHLLVAELCTQDAVCLTFVSHCLFWDQMYFLIIMDFGNVRSRKKFMQL